MDRGENIVLIGMPGSGKSTIGPLLAAELELGFVDIDALLTATTGNNPRDLVNTYGLERFLQLQEEEILRLEVEDHVIATGGSVVRSPAAMERLSAAGNVIYLKAALEDIEKRLAPGRKLARADGQSLRDTLEQRSPLYEGYADFTVDCSGKSPSVIVAEIKAAVGGHSDK